MTQRSVPESAQKHGGRDSTRALIASPKNLADAAAFLMLDEDQTDTFVRCLKDEPLKRLLGITEWLAKHESDPDYDPSSMVVGWAKLRGAGCFRPPEPTPAERTWSGNSEEQDAEITEAVENGSRTTKPAGRWGRFSNEQIEENLRRMGQ